MQVALLVLVICLMDSVGLVIVRVTSVTVLVVVTGGGVDVTVGCRVTEALVTVDGGSVVVLVEVLVEVKSVRTLVCYTSECGSGSTC